jgi:hypothetical protein
MVRSGIAVLIGVLAAGPALYAQHESIVIKSSKRPTADRVSLYGELNGRSVVLQCTASHSDCKELSHGEYSIERLLEGEGSYKGCANVDLYRLGADSFQEEPLGEYCLIERK